MSLFIDDGYGATCWELVLHNEKKKSIYVHECSFYEGREPDGILGTIPYWEEDKTNSIHIYARSKDDGIWPNWPGLEKVVELGLEASKILLSK